MTTEAKAGTVNIVSSNMKYLYWAIFSSLTIVAMVSFWIFSRFTVDDAFITWRYGKNLVDSGVWGYNPVDLDLTQSYTNPIYAALGIVPHVFGIDIVAFFKSVSLVLIFGFAVWYSKRTGMGIFIVLFYAIPATFIHAFSGLETFLYVCLVAALFIFLIEDSFWKVILCSLVLFMTRPESWVLLGLVPMFYLLPKGVDDNVIFSKPKNIILKIFDLKKYDFKSGIIAAVILALPMTVYFYFNKVYFGYALPNTFYVKSGGGFSLQNFIYFGFMALPILGILFAKKIRVFLVAALFFGAVILSYSTSSLAMNYVDRFAFHIVSPAYLVLVYVAAKALRGNFYVSLSSAFDKYYKISYKSFALSLAVVWVSLFGIKNLSATSLVHIANYYPRAIDSHAELGKAIREDSLVDGFGSMSFGDAGMTAYHSNISSLDNIGLGSTMVAHEGLSDETLDFYRPDVVVFHSRPDSIRLKSHNQGKIYSWVMEQNYKKLCQVYWKQDYTLTIYSRYSLNSVKNVCQSSKKLNDMGDKEYFLKHGTTAPWEYWRT